MCEGWISAMTKRIHWFKHRLANVREMNLSHDWTRWMTQERIFGHELKDSLIQTLSRWMKKKKKQWISAITKRFTDLNTESTTARGVNFSLAQKIHWFKHYLSLSAKGMNFTHDEWIHWFKQWVTEWKRSEFQLWSKDSLTQTLIPYMWEEWISVTTEWFTNILKERGANFSHDQTIHTFKESTNARAVNFSHDQMIPSLYVRGMNLLHDWMIHRLAEWHRNESRPWTKKDSLIQTPSRWTRQERISGMWKRIH